MVQSNLKDLVVFDYSTSEIHFYKVSFDVNIDDEYIESLGFNTNECYWMFSEFIDIIKHKVVLGPLCNKLNLKT